MVFFIEGSLVKFPLTGNVGGYSARLPRISHAKPVFARARKHTQIRICATHLRSGRDRMGARTADVANGFSLYVGGWHLHMKTRKSRGLLASYSRAKNEVRSCAPRGCRVTPVGEGITEGANYHRGDRSCCCSAARCSLSLSLRFGRLKYSMASRSLDPGMQISNGEITCSPARARLDFVSRLAFLRLFPSPGPFTASSPFRTCALSIRSHIFCLSRYGARARCFPLYSSHLNVHQCFRTA